MSELISAHLIDHFVPFLPLERRHILLCIRDYMLSHGFTPTDERVTAIADSLQVKIFFWIFLFVNKLNL